MERDVIYIGQCWLTYIELMIPANCFILRNISVLKVM